MITCRELIGFLWRYLDGELDPVERRRFEAHLAVCPSCVAYLRSYGDVIKLTRDAYRDPEAPVPDSVPEDLVRAILDSRRRAG